MRLSEDDLIEDVAERICYENSDWIEEMDRYSMERIEHG
jgi:hypothetical protein